MPKRFTGPATEIKPFANWVHKVATSSDAKWRNLRRKLREESTPEPGERRKASESFLKEMHRQFPSMTGCRTDISCLKQLFEAFVNMLDLNESRLKKGLRAVNKILPLMYVTDSQLGAYRTFVYQLTPTVKKRYGASNFNANFKHFLQPAGGSESATDAYAFKVAAEEKAAEALSYRQKHKIPVTEASIVTAVRRWGESDDLAELFMFAQIMTGSRKSEIMLPSVSNFEHEVSLVYGYLVMWGTAKEKGSEPELAAVEPDEGEVVEDIKVDDSGAPPGWSLRRRVVKPILRIVKNPETLEMYTVADVLRAIRLVRAGWDVQAKLDAGGTNAEVAALHDDELAKGVRSSFKDAAAYAAVHRTNQISTHFLRKIYANYGYRTLGDVASSTFAGWASQYLGWKLSSGLGTSISYSDLEIMLLPPKLEDMDEAKAQIQALVGALVSQPAADADIEDADLKTRILHERGLKRSFIDVTGENDVQARIPFNKRRRDGSALERARESMRLLIATGVVPTQMMLRKLGYGGVAAKGAMAAGPSVPPGA
jgi:hypothetical protein